MGNNNSILVKKYPSIHSKDLYKIDNILDDDKSIPYIDVNTVDYLFYCISPRFWSPINTTYTCYFCTSTAHQENKHFKIYACNKCINTIKSNSIAIRHDHHHPVSIKLNSLLRFWIDSNVNSSHCFDDYEIVYDNCYICHKQIHNNSKTDISTAPEGFAIAHFDCAKMDGFYGYCDSNDYTEFLQDISMLRNRYIAPNESITRRNKLPKIIYHILWMIDFPLWIIQ